MITLPLFFQLIIMNKQVNYLVENIIAQAKLFLEDADEFYPFGSIITSENELKPCSIFLEDENPPSIQIFKLLESYIQDGLAMKKYILGAIGLNIIINNDDSTSILEIKIYQQGDLPIESFFFRYTKSENEYYFNQINLA